MARAALIALVALVAGCEIIPLEPDPPEPPESLVAMTFNVRYDNGLPNSDDDAWVHPDHPRRDAAIATILDSAPDVLGVQEALWNQVQDLEEGLLPRYRWDGVGRDDGDRAGEFCAVFWRNDLYERTAGGTFWLSLEPQEPGSVYPGAATTRIATWVELQERRTGRFVTVLNTHWDHVSQDARTHAAALIVQELDIIAPSPRGRIVLGDLNLPEDNVAFSTLLNGGALTDAYRDVHEEHADEATFHGFGGGVTGRRIDHVLPSAGFFTVDDARIVRDEGPGGFPSDHFPVVAELRW